MTYRINGVALNDRTRGWTLVRESIPVSSLEYTNNTFDISGIDGTIAFPTTRRPVSFTFTIKSALESRPALLALLSSPSIVITSDDPARSNYSASGYLIGSSVDTYHEALGWAKDSFVIEIPGGCWRSTTTTTSPVVTAVAPSVVFDVFTGISAPVQDAIIRLKGPLTDAQVQDSSGSFFVVEGAIADGSFVRFESASGRAWLTTSDTWVGGTELTGEVDYGGPRGMFEITPNFTNPDTRTGKLTLSQTALGTGAGVSVRGRNSYLF